MSSLWYHISIGNHDCYPRWTKKTLKNFLGGCLTAEGDCELIRNAVQRGQLPGSGQFVEEVFKKIARRVEFRGQERPKKKEK